MCGLVNGVLDRRVVFRVDEQLAVSVAELKVPRHHRAVHRRERSKHFCRREDVRELEEVVKCGVLKHTQLE